jgi:membrane dipeptidase
VTLRSLHEDSIVIDLHTDSLIQARTVGYRLEVRHHNPILERLGFYHADLPRLREGGVTGQFFGLVTFPVPELGCAAACRRQIAKLRKVADEQGLIWARTADDVRRAKREGTLAVFTGIEGGHNLEGRIEHLEGFAQVGVRYLGLAHFSANAICAPSGGKGASATAPLTDFGRAVIGELNRLGTIVDLAHVGKGAFLDVCGRSSRPVIVSHTGISAAYPLWRNVDDDQLRAVARSDGVVGIIFAWRYLGARRQGVEMLAPHFEHVRKVIGVRHLAIGSDFDGAIEPVRGLENVSRLPEVTALLQRMKWSEEEIRGVLGENVLRVLRNH